jgi:lipopolysaccharide assembly outer membrane protein LptD (OstA)
VNKYIRKYLFLFWLLPTMLLSQAEVDSSSTLAQAPPITTQKSDIDTTIHYEAKDIYNYVQDKKSVFVGNAVVNYQNITLKAGKITIDWDNKLIIAESLPDTVWTKTDSTGLDSTMTVGRKGGPILIEGSTQMAGEKMVYNYQSKKGRVVRGRTEMEGGRYIGTQIKKVNDKTYNVSQSSFTTCDLDSNPHFHFESRRLKMITGEKIIAKPVLFFIDKIPIAALPFAVFPNKTGRQSGLILPRYGQSTTEGRYLRGLGYYWAKNEYFDAKGTVDFFEKTGVLFRSGANYNVRYKMNGSINGSLTRKNFSGTQSRRWDLRLRHSQEIDRTSRFSASGYFVSDKNLYREFSSNLNSRLTRELRSTATYSKSWPQRKLSLSVNLSRVQDLQDDVASQTLPQLTFRKGQSQIFAPKKKSGRTRGRGRQSRPQPKWYHSLYYSYNSTLLNSKREFLVKTTQDTTKEVDRKRSLGHNINLSLSSPKKFFGWLSLNQSMSIREDWFDETNAYVLNQSTNQINSVDKGGFAARHIFSYNASANTKLYGMIAPNFADIQAIRHVVTPSITFRYQPDFSTETWGYYTTVKDTSGNEIKKDRFSGTPSGGSQFVSFSIRNLFQMKKGFGEEEKKIDLFTTDMSSGYNFKADRFPLSDLRTSWQANPARNFSLSAGTTHSFYQWDVDPTTDRGSVVDTYLFKNGGWQTGNFIRLTNFRTNFSIRLKGQETGKKDSEEELENEMLNYDLRHPVDGESTNVLEDDLIHENDRFDAERIRQSPSIPWRVNLNFNFTLDKRDPNNAQKRYYLDVSGAEMNLTKNWRISYTAHYDLEKRTVSHHRLNFYRNLHCWEAQIDWVPSGISKRVYFRINIKSNVLRDIKLEKGGGRSRVYGY